MAKTKLSDVGSDFVVALRRLRRAPVFTATAVILLGLGIGVGTAFVNVINGVFRAVSVEYPGAVRFAASTSDASTSSWLRAEDVEAVAAHPPDSLLWIIGDSQSRSATARIGGTPLSVVVDSISGPYFSVLGGQPVAGRLLGPADDRAADLTPAVVVSERLWRTRLGGDPSIVGSTAYLAGQPVVVVGVVSEAFPGLAVLVGTDVWAPDRVLPVRQLYGRLRDGVSIEQANAEIQSRYPSPTTDEPNRTLVVRAGVSPPLEARMIALVAGVLAIGALVVAVAAGSLVLLLLARVLGNQRDTGVRLMLGASLWDVVRLWVAEVTIIATSGAVAGILLAAWLAHWMISFLISQTGFPGMKLDTSPDWRVLLYVVGLTTAVAAGIVVTLARHLANANALAGTSAASGAGGATARSAGTRNRLTTAQVAVATTCLLVAMFVLRTTLRDTVVDPGFDPSHIAIAWIDQSGPDKQRVEENVRLAFEAAALTPGADHAALTTNTWATRVRTDASPYGLLVTYSGITPGFFEIRGTPPLRGRSLSSDDENNASPVVVINESTAAAFWPGRDPIGRMIWIDGTTLKDAAKVIGVVPDVQSDGLSWQTRRLGMYVPYSYFRQRPGGQVPVAVIARGPGPAADLLKRLRDSIGQLAPQVGFTATRTMDEELRRGRGAAPAWAGALGSIGLLGLLIAVTGLYGLTAYLAEQRRREFGIRKALGATSWFLIRMVAIEGLPPLVRGMAIGVVPGFLLAGWLRARQFYTMQMLDPIPWLVVCSVLLLAGLVGTVVPFHRMLRGEAAAMLKEL